MNVNHAAAVLASLAVLATAACSHTTTITARPGGTSIWVNGEELGKDQVTTDISNGMGGKYTVRAEAPGKAALEVEVSREQIAWGPLAGAIGGCLGGGCVGGTMGLIVGSALGPLAAISGPCGVVVGGAPWLALLMSMNTGPNALVLDLDARTVTATPDTTLEVVEGGGEAPTTPATPTGPVPDEPVNSDFGNDSTVAPFDY